MTTERRKTSYPGCLFAEACFCYTTWCLSMQLVVLGAYPVPVSWHSVTPRNHSSGLAYLPYPQRFPLIVLGNSSSPIYCLVNIMFRSKKESKWSTNRGNSQMPHQIVVCPLFNLCFTLRASFLISPKHMTCLHDRTVLFSFWKTKIITPRTAGRATLQWECPGEAYTLSWQKKYRNCLTIPAQVTKGHLTF